MKLCTVQSAVGIRAWTLREYLGAINKIRNLLLMTPNICSIALHSDAWHKLNSSLGFAGLRNVRQSNVSREALTRLLCDPIQLGDCEISSSFSSPFFPFPFLCNTPHGHIPFPMRH